MPLHVRNTATQRLERFEPLEPGTVRMYVCGPTVYDYFHIGNARPFVVFDMVRRWLEQSGYEVTYAQNITDIDDKIIKKAREEGVAASDITARYSQAYHDDLKRLHVKPYTHEPTATGHIKEIIQLIADLDAHGMTYAVDGDVYYRVEKFAEYGKLSGKKPDDLRAGASQRVQDELSARKEHPADFALWKAQKQPDEPAWDSPWGKGRPGWHIECSAMSTALLGPSFDIHAGGEDLIFPHHENEIAQSEAATGKPYVKYWLHNGFLNIAKEETPLTEQQSTLVAKLEEAVTADDEAAIGSLRDELAEGNVYVEIDREAKSVTFKASKSLKNVPKLREIYDAGFDGQLIRFFLLRAHYRSPLTFSWSLLDDARTQLRRWQDARQRLDAALPEGVAPAGDGGTRAEVDRLWSAFTERMDDDFNTPGAIGVAFEMVSLINALLGSADPAPGDLAAASEVLGRMEVTMGLELANTDEVPADILALVEQRSDARARRDFAESDRIRDELAAKGWVVKDGKDGATVQRL